MKKTIVLAGLILVTTLSQAQIVREQSSQTPGGATTASAGETTGAFKPESGAVSFEMNFNPMSGSPLSLNYLRARYFLSDDLALRVGFSLATKSVSDNKSFEYAVLPGIEKHFKGTDRLSPYLGAEILIAGRGSSYSNVDAAGTTITVKGAWGDKTSNRGFFNFGVNLLAGCDFYFARHFYVGLEAGYGLSLMSNSDVITTTTPNGGSSKIDTNKGGSTFQLGPNYNSALRLGFLF